MATKVIDEKKRFSYVVTFDLFRQTSVKISVGNKIYEFVNVINDYNTFNGCNTIAVLFDFKSHKYVAVNIQDKKFNSKECVIIE
ncbi:hypothetical protein BC669P1_00037 [Bacteroides phage BC669P1]|nr:hypothetical protein BC669P1_00037 [Bacteroides phage BC669P1]